MESSLLFKRVRIHNKGSGSFLFALLLFIILSPCQVKATAKTATTAGNWSNASIWSPTGVPASTDDVTINLSADGTVTVDSIYTCHNLYVGGSNNHNVTLIMLSSSCSLTINGDLQMNSGNNNGKTYILNAGSGTINVAGTFSMWSTHGNNNIEVGSGAINFTPAVTTTTAPSQQIIFTAGGTITFNSSFSQGHHEGLTTYLGCTINFYGNYTIPSGADNSNWNSLGTANFYGTDSISAAKNLSINNVVVMPGASLTLDTIAGGVFLMNGSLTLNSSSTFTMQESFQLDGSLTNNGGTFSGGSTKLTLNGNNQILGGSSNISLPNVYMAPGSGPGPTYSLSYLVNTGVTASSLVFTAQNQNITINIATGNSLTVTNNLTMNQPGANNISATLSVGGGTLTVSGNLIFSGNNNSLTRLCQIEVGSGTFTLSGTITWNTANISGTEIISVGTGVINFTKSVTMGSASGTIKVTSSGDINFNGTTAPSLSFGGATAPVFSTAYGSNLTFAKGLTVATTALTFVNGSNAIFGGNGTITPTAAITFANFQINPGVTATLAGNIAVKGNWTDNGTCSQATYTVSFNGYGTQTISDGGGTETFYNLKAATSGATIQLLSNVTITDSLYMVGDNININGYTFTLGNSAGATLDRSAGEVYGGTWKRWFPASAITSSSGAYYGLFPIGTSSQYRPVTINSTVSPTTPGYVTASHTDGTGGTTVSYTDNEGSNIQEITSMHSDLGASLLAGGTYTIAVKFTKVSATGTVADLKLETNTGGTMGSAGTTVATIGAITSPTSSRSGLTAANLANTFVIGTNNSVVTPLYLYLYSRKTGNWNDSSSTGTWSYTAGGSGAACSCHPNSQVYATIDSSHTVTVVASDSVLYLDILNGGVLTVNSAKTFNVGANMETYGSGTFTNSGTLNVAGDLGITPATSPTVTGTVLTLTSFTLNSGAAYTQTSDTLHNSGDMTINGTLTIGSSGKLVFDGSSNELSGTGSVVTGSGGTFPIVNDKTIDAGTSLTIGTGSVNTTLAIANTTTINNLGSITLNGNLTGADPNGTVWTNNSYSYLGVSGTVLTTGVFDVADASNTVEYTGSGAQTITVPLVSYSILKAANAGTKTLGGVSIVVDSALIIGGSVLIKDSTNVISGWADLDMSGTSQFSMIRNVVGVYPELGGNFNLSAGTITITQNADSAVIQSAQYYNLTFNGSTPYDVSDVSDITNNLNVQGSSTIENNEVLTVGGTLSYSSTGVSTLGDSIAVGGISITAGTLVDGTNSINVTGSGGWTLSGGTYTATGALYFTGGSAQTLGGTAASQTFNVLCTNKSSGTVTVGGSTTTLNLNADMILQAGTFAAGTAATINMNEGNWTNNGGAFTPGSGTVVFEDTGEVFLNGSGGADTFNNVTIDKTIASVSVTGSVTSLTLNGNMLLTSGTLNSGTSTSIYMTSGNWTNNGGSFVPSGSTVTFNSSGAQAIKGTAATQSFNSITMNKSANTLRTGGSTTTLTLNGNMTLSAGTLNVDTSTTVNVAGNWSMTAGTFTNAGNTVIMNGSAMQNMSSTGAFNNLTIDNTASYINLTGNITVNGLLTFTSGLIQTNANQVALGSAATTGGAATASYIYGNEQISFPNASAPSRTFNIGDASNYTPVLIAFTGTTTGSGSLTAYTTAGNSANIATSGINSLKSVARTWTVSNNGIGGFTCYSPTYNFVAGDIETGANYANFVVRMYSSSAWSATTTGTQAITSTQASCVTVFGQAQVGEVNTLTVATNPSNTTACSGTSTSFSSTSTSIPAPTIQWQRDPNTGTFANITSGMDGSVYTNYTSSTLNISNANGLNNYKYRAVFTNINGTVNSTGATLTVNTTPTITGTTPTSECGTGTVNLGATASAGTINWYAASAGGSSLGTGTSYTTPSISTTTTYYVDATSSGCTTASRTSVTATVNAIPTITSTSPGAICNSGAIALSATSSAGTINWWTASSGGSLLTTGNNYTTPTITVTTTYYVDATSNGLTTTSRTAVTATVNPLPAASASYTSCPGVDGNTTINIAGSGGTSPYTYSINGSKFNSVDSFHVANGSTQNLYVIDNNNCASGATSYILPTATPTQIADSNSYTSCSCGSMGENRDIYLTEGINLVAIINDEGNNLGTVTATVYTRASPVLINDPGVSEDAAMSRSFVINFADSTLSPNVQVKLPFLNGELSALETSSQATTTLYDDVYSITDLGATRYRGPHEDSTYNTAGNSYLAYSAQLANGSVLGGSYVTIGLSSGGDIWLHHSGSGAPLPVKLLSFNAVAQNETVLTTWSTALEINNAYFTVERSADALNFSEVARVQGAGNSTTTLNYDYVDMHPLTGTSYYRLRQTDFNGNYTFSDTRAVDRTGPEGAAGLVTVYPNPAHDVVNVHISNPSGQVQLKVFDMAGWEVYSKTADAGPANTDQNILIPTEILSPGVYVVCTYTGKSSFMQKLVVQ